jgi:superoxide dismutase, Cu-Zn family
MRTTLPLLALTLLLPGCATTGTGASAGSSATPSASTSPSRALATVRDVNGRALGTLTVAESGAGFVVSGTLEHLAPGTHGIHLHTIGMCDGTFTSAGGHWNPTGRQHGFDNPMGPHLGDMQNIVAGADSTAQVAVNTRGGLLRGVNGLLDGDGAAVVVHAGPDDYRTDPAGNSGARIACGVIR